MLKRTDTSSRFQIIGNAIRSIRSHIARISFGFLVLFFKKVALIFCWKSTITPFSPTQDRKVHQSSQDVDCFEI